jgi:hypothetical protein
VPISSYDWDWPRAEREFRQASSRSRANPLATRGPAKRHCLHAGQHVRAFDCPESDHLSAEWILSLLDEFHGIKAFVATKGAAA